jgi:hypothetical protein
MKLKKLIATILKKNKTYVQQAGRPDNRRLAKKSVQWLTEYSISQQFCCALTVLCAPKSPITLEKRLIIL